jgi:hypothetical protein
MLEITPLSQVIGQYSCMMPNPITQRGFVTIQSLLVTKHMRFQMPYIHYIDIKSNEQCQQEIAGLTSLVDSGTSLFPGLPYNDMFIIRW